MHIVNVWWQVSFRQHADMQDDRIQRIKFVGVVAYSCIKEKFSFGFSLTAIRILLSICHSTYLSMLYIKSTVRHNPTPLVTATTHYGHIHCISICIFWLLASKDHPTTSCTQWRTRLKFLLIRYSFHHINPTLGDIHRNPSPVDLYSSLFISVKKS